MRMPEIKIEYRGKIETGSHHVTLSGSGKATSDSDTLLQESASATVYNAERLTTIASSRHDKYRR